MNKCVQSVEVPWFGNKCFPKRNLNLCNIGLKPSKTTQKNQSKNVPAGNTVFKVNNRNTRTSGEICLKFTIKTPERLHCCRSYFFIVKFKLALVFLLLTLSR